MPASGPILDVIEAPYGLAPDGTPHLAHPTQQKILDWKNRLIALGPSAVSGLPVLYVQHGVNAGGTRGCLAAVIQRLWDEPGLRVLIGRKDYNDLRLSVMETFFEIMPRQLIISQNLEEHRYQIDAEGGASTVFFRDLKDVRGLGSQEFGCILVVEASEIEELAYRILKQRCRQAGHVPMLLLEGNPPHEGHWLERLSNPASPDRDADLTRLILPSYENWDFMTPGYRQSLEAMPDFLRKRFLLGETGALPEGTPVYPAFIESVHVRPTFLIPDRPILRFWDFGLRRAACLWGQLDREGRLLIHKEWLALETPEEQFLDGVVVRTNEWFGPRPCEDHGDPAARQRDPHGVSTLDRLAKRGIQLRFRQTTYGLRIPLVNAKLSQMVGGVPLITISPDCKTLIEALAGGYRYPKLSEGQAFSPMKDAPMKDGWFEHLANAFEYGIVGLFAQARPAIQRSIQRRRARRLAIERFQGAAVF